MTKNCPNCRLELKEAELLIEETLRYQCPSCHYSNTEPKITRTAKETAVSPLQLKQKVTTLSQGRLGMYFNQDLVRSLHLKAGQEIYLAVPDAHTVVIRVIPKS